MFMGVLFRGNRHHPLRYLAVLLITFGIAAFFWLGLEEQTNRHDQMLSLFGIGLSLSSLFLDGMIGSLQDDLLKHYEVSAHDLMFSTNAWQWLAGCIGLLVTGEIFTVVPFLRRYPTLLGEILLVSFYSAMGQLFIFFTIAKFKALTNTIITTMRKFLTIVANTFWFGHQMGVAKWMTIAVVAVGVVAERYADGLEKARNKPAGKVLKDKDD